MVTAEEALKSDDPIVVKRLRSSISAQITCDLNILEKELSKKRGEAFNFEKISPQLVKTQKKKLVAHFELIQRLHDRFMEVRDEGLNEETEASLVESDVEFMTGITSKVCPVLDSIDSYEEGLIIMSKHKSLCRNEKEFQDNVAKVKRDFTVVHDKIEKELLELESLEDGDKKSNLIKLLPTESYIRDQSTCFNDIKRACNKLKEVYQVSDCESKEDANYDVEHSKFFSLDAKLKTYELAKNLLQATGSSKKSHEEIESHTPLKINKPEALKFSGNAREFASFKRDFMAIVVPHRDDTQIGIHFRQAIPDKHKHLISNKDLCDWKSMLSVIEEECASPKIIIDLTVNEIEKMRTASTDKGFIEFVEALEKIVRDLETLNQLPEIANTSVLSKLEAKLPPQINHDWTKKVIKDKISKMTSNQKFTLFMEFLSDAKEMTKYNISLPNGAGKNSCFVTGTFIAQNKEDSRDTPKNKSPNTLPCLACSADGATDLSACLHHMSSCAVWGSLPHRDRVMMVKCIKHPFSKDDHPTQDCKRVIRACSFCQKDNVHNSLLCPKFQITRKGSTNISRKAHTSASQRLEHHPELAPTLLYSTFVKTIGHRRLGTLIDSGSTDDYILNTVAKQMKLKGHPVELITEGFGGIETKIQTHLYYVPIYDKRGRQHHLPCYGTDTITNDLMLPDTSSYNRLC